MDDYNWDDFDAQTAEYLTNDPTWSNYDWSPDQTDWINDNYGNWLSDYSSIPTYLDPNTAAYEAPVWLPEQPQFSFDFGSYLQPSSLSGLTNLGIIPSQIGGLDVSMAPYNDNYLSAANANALSLGLPFDANLNLSGDEAFLQTYMATGNPVVAEQARREAELMAEEKALENMYSSGVYGDTKLPEGALINPMFDRSRIDSPFVESAGETYLRNQEGNIVGYVNPEGGISYYDEIPGYNQEAGRSSGAAGLVGKAASAALDKALSPKEQALNRMYEQYNKQAAAKEAYQNSGTGKALAGLEGALAVAQALTGKNKGATTTARGNQGQAFSPTYVGSSTPKTLYAKGGAIEGKGGLLSLAEQMAYQLAHSKGLIQGEGGGQDDVVDVKAAPGEYVMDAEIVSALGDGNNEEGARKLDQMRVNIRKHKRTGGLTSIPPKAKAPEQYMKKGK